MCSQAFELIEGIKDFNYSPHLPVANKYFRQKCRDITAAPIAGLRTQYQHGPREVNALLSGIKLTAIGRRVVALANCTMTNFVQFEEMAGIIRP